MGDAEGKLLKQKIKGDAVVATKPNGSFVTILKDGINNTSVKMHSREIRNNESCRSI